MNIYIIYIQYSYSLNRKFCSTTVINRRRPVFDMSFNSPSFTPSSPIQRCYNSTLADSPTLFQYKESVNRSKPIISQKLNFDEQSEEEDNTSDWDKSYNIGPKNLLTVSLNL